MLANVWNMDVGWLRRTGLLYLFLCICIWARSLSFLLKLYIKLYIRSELDFPTASVSLPIPSDVWFVPCDHGSRGDEGKECRCRTRNPRGWSEDHAHVPAPLHL